MKKTIHTKWEREFPISISEPNISWLQCRPFYAVGPAPACLPDSCPLGGGGGGASKQHKRGDSAKYVLLNHQNFRKPLKQINLLQELKASYWSMILGLPIGWRHHRSEGDALRTTFYFKSHAHKNCCCCCNRHGSLRIRIFLGRIRRLQMSVIGTGTD